MTAQSTTGQEQRRTPLLQRLKLGPYLLITPAILVILLALGYPLVWQFVTSLQKYGRAQVFGQPPEFVGLQNYVDLFTDSYMWVVVGRSVAFCLIVAAATMFVGVLIALLMRSAPKWVRLCIQISLLLAWAMPVVAAMTIWSWLFDWRRGLVNWVLGTSGHNWLENPLSFFMVAGIIVIWMSVPFVAFSVYTGLTQVPNEVLEAAAMDGASPLQQMWRIIMPMIKRRVLGVSATGFLQSLRRALGNRAASVVGHSFPTLHSLGQPDCGYSGQCPWGSIL